MRGLFLGLIAVLFIGALGEVRRSGRSGSVDFRALTEFQISSAWEASQDELVGRRTGTSLAVVALVPERHGFLYGTTYVAALGFWIPRSFWRDKPRGAGAHAVALLFLDRDSMEGYEGGGYPVNGAPEAYWNFGYFGVVWVFTLFGAILGAVARWVVCRPSNPFAVTTLVIVNF